MKRVCAEGTLTNEAESWDQQQQVGGDVATPKEEGREHLTSRTGFEARA